MLDYQDIKMCISYMERKNIEKTDFYSGGRSCIMERDVHQDDTIYKVFVYSMVTEKYHPTIFFNKSEVQHW